MRKYNTPDLFIGARLGAARSQTGITLEKAAKETRIRVQRLREIEADDFSGFAHPAYARLFLLDYANYLGLPTEEIRPMLPENAAVAVEGLQYLNALAENAAASRLSHAHTPPRKPRIVRLLAFGILIAILAVVGFYFFSTLKKLERISRSRTGTVSTEEIPKKSNPSSATKKSIDSRPVEPTTETSLIKSSQEKAPTISLLPSIDPMFGNPPPEENVERILFPAP